MEKKNLNRQTLPLSAPYTASLYYTVDISGDGSLPGEGSLSELFLDS